MSESSETKKVPLHERHVEQGARMVPFAGYSMPVKYGKIKEEHRSVRTSAGLFDVSHMGRVEVRGPEAIDAVNRLMTNDVTALTDGRAIYTVMCNEQGGIIDDLVIYRLGEDRLLLCINAANRQRDIAHIGAALTGGVEMEDQSDQTVQIAIQGPKAEEILAKIADTDLESIKFFRCRKADVAGVSTLVARTGYTGEDGFELYLPVDGGEEVFDALLDAGGDELTLCGLGCRDTLRLEAGLLLHGQDIDESTNPLEAGLGWLVKFDAKGEFIGRQALEAVRQQGTSRKLRGFVLQGRGVLRPGYDLQIEGEAVGRVTSGGYAPTLEASIGLGYIDREFADADAVDIILRRRSVPAKVVDPPFYKRSK